MTKKSDIYDGEPWTEMDVKDLTAALCSVVVFLNVF